MSTFSTDKVYSTIYPEETTTKNQIPMYAWLLVISITSIITGLIWDISWHMSIGRDSLFSPPHLFIYSGGLIAGLSSIFKLFQISAGKNQEEKNRSVSFWGMKAPLGTLFCIWGAAAMLTSAPFDDWWHNTYGLDVKILSPPHAVLVLGMLMIIFGTMLKVLSLQNQLESVSGKGNSLSRYLFAYSCGVFLLVISIFIIENMGRSKMHLPLFYQLGGVLILPLVSGMKGSRLKYPATAIAGVYSIIMLLQLWVLPLFPAQPKLAPILNPVTHFVPIIFPLLLILPGYAMDRLHLKLATKNLWIGALWTGTLFFTVFLLSHWFFAYFLNYSELSHTWVFQSHTPAYYWDPNRPGRFGLIPFKGTNIQFFTGIAIALVLSVLSSRIALAWGNWMRRVQR